MATTLSSTFHSFAYGLVRRYSSAELYAAPLRLLSAPEQDVVLQELLTDNPRVGAVARGAASRRSAPAASRARCRRCWRGPASGGSTPTSWSRSARRGGSRSSAAAGLFLQQYLDVLDDQSAIDYPDLIARAVLEAAASTATSCAPGSPTSSSTSTRTPTRARSAAARDRRRRARPDGRGRPRPVDLRLPGRRRARHPRLPRRASAAPTATPAPVVALRHHPPLRLAAAARLAVDRRLAWRRPAHRSARARSRRSARPSRPATSSGRPGRRADLRHRARRDRARRRPAAPRPPRGRRRLVRHGGPGPLRPRARSRACAGPWPPPACPSRWPATTPRWSASPRCCRCSARCARSSTPTSRSRRRGLRRRRPGRGAADLARSAASTRPRCAR